MAIAGLVAGSFLVGQRLGDDDVATIPVVAPTQVAEATSVPEPVPTSPPPTATPPPATPTSPPQPASVTNDAAVPAPGVPGVEPVADVANLVAPAVVLVTNELGQGSGIIYDESGLVLTNAHVVGNFTEVTVQLASGIKVPGEVLGADASTDVAVISIETEAEFGVAELAPDSSVEVGQLAVAIGSPFGLEQTVTAGIVSAKGRVVGTVAMIQTDAPINPGNSGGALADREGRVIGMNTAIRTDGSGGNVGVGFAIPADTAKLIADRIIAGDSLDQGYLGIEGQTPVIGLPGAFVTNVLPGTAAESGGLLVDDLIVGFGGFEIRSMQDLAAAVRLQPPGAEVQVDIIRGADVDGNVGEPITVTVTLGVFDAALLEPN